MKSVGRSLLVFGCYFLVLGAALMLYPKILELFDVAADSPWIRVLGLAISVIGVFYVVAGRNEYHEFAKYSLLTRSAQLVFFTIVVLSDLLPVVLLAFAAVEFLFGVWTLLELRKLYATQKT